MQLERDAAAPQALLEAVSRVALSSSIAASAVPVP